MIFFFKLDESSPPDSFSGDFSSRITLENQEEQRFLGMRFVCIAEGPLLSPAFNPDWSGPGSFGPKGLGGSRGRSKKCQVVVDDDV